MKKAGIILIVLQCIGTLGSVIAGNNPFSGGFWGTLGYFLFGIIGIILLIIAATRKKKQENQEDNEIDDDENEEIGNETEAYSEDETIIGETLKAKYERMFRQTFSKVTEKETFEIKEKTCTMYFFHIHDTICIGDFQYMIVVQGKTTRYFAVEYSYNDQYVLCEWVFENGKEKAHFNFGEVPFERLYNKTAMKELLTEILTEN